MSDANASGAQSAAEIERDLDRRRARLNQDLNALEDRMSPNQLIDQAAAYLRSGQGAAFTRNLGTSVRDNPIPAVLVGVGLAWLMASGGGSSSSRPATRGYPQARPIETRPYDLHERAHHAGYDVIRLPDESEESHRSRMDEARGAVFGMKRHAQESAQSFSSRVQDAMSAARDWAVRSAGSVQNSASAMAGSMSDSAHRMTDQFGQMSDQMGNWTGSASDSFNRSGEMIRRRSGDMIASMAGNPILLGAVGVTAGALLGVMLPHFEIEDQYLGDAGDAVRNTVQDAAQAAYERGQQAVQATIDAGRSAAQEHGLATDQSPSDMVDKAKRVAEAALQAGKSAATGEASGGASGTTSAGRK